MRSLKVSNISNTSADLLPVRHVGLPDHPGHARRARREGARPAAHRQDPGVWHHHRGNSIYLERYIFRESRIFFLRQEKGVEA